MRHLVHCRIQKECRIDLSSLLELDALAIVVFL